MIRCQDKKIRYSKKCFCEELEKDVVIEATGIVLDYPGIKGIKCEPIKCSEKSYYPYSCSLGRIEDCGMRRDGIPLRLY